MGGGVEHKKVAFVLPQGWVKADSNDKDVSLAVPSGWRQGANTLFGTGNVADILATNDPSAPKLTADEAKNIEDITKGFDRINKEDELKNLDKLAQKGIILHCVSTNQKVIGEELTRFYVKKKSQSSNWTWLDTDGSEQDCFNSKQIAKDVTLPIGLAHRMQATWQQTDGAMYTQISYLIPNGRDLYVLRFITVESPEVVTTIEKEVADSLRLN